MGNTTGVGMVKCRYLFIDISSGIVQLEDKYALFMQLR